MSHIKRLKEALDHFLADDTSVVSIKGAWGIGKTHFWKKYSEKNRVKANKIAYSYVSLFGVNSLDELREKIFSAGEPLKGDKEVSSAFQKANEQFNKLEKFIPVPEEKKRNVVRSILAFGVKLPWFKEWQKQFAAAKYGLVREYLICFDDIERKGNNLSIADFMGLINELTEQKECKVIIILDDKSFDENGDKETFDKYREKVIDTEIGFNPTIEENLRLIFSSSDRFFEPILEAAQALKVLNIRILRKSQRTIERLFALTGELQADLEAELVTHVLLFSWIYFGQTGELTLDRVQSYHKDGSWMALLSEGGKELPEPDKQWQEVTNQIGHMVSDYDDHIINLLRDGILDEAAFKEDMDKLCNDIETQAARERLRDAWRVYADSFDDNAADFVAALAAVLDSDIQNIGIWEFAGAIKAIEDFGEGADEYVDRYIEVHRCRLAGVDLDENVFGRSLEIPQLVAAIEEERRKLQAGRGIDEVTERIATGNGFSLGDVNYLSAQTSEELIDWMQSSPSDLSKKIKKGLLYFGGVRTGDAIEENKYRKIHETTVDALKEIARTNDFNRIRVTKLYGIVVD